MHVGVLGLGRMGSAILDRLGDQGFEIFGWNRTPVVAGSNTKAEIFPEIGGVVARSDIIILSLFNDQAVTDVVGRLCEHDLSGKVVVDTSTTRPDTLRDLEPLLNKAGALVADAPIAGGPDMVRAGKAGLYVGGGRAAVEQFCPVADAFAARVIHVGDLGAGATAKVFNNMMLCGYWQTLKEAMLTGQAGGLSMAQMVDILSGSPAASPAFLSRTEVLLGQSDMVGFPVSGAVKDVELFVDIAREFGVETPSINAGLESFRTAEKQGLSDFDLATMVCKAVISGNQAADKTV